MKKYKQIVVFKGNIYYLQKKIFSYVNDVIIKTLNTKNEEILWIGNI